ncbi:MAG: C45 family peptidase [Bacteroidales bacterium]|nr:C45 family peptidase [Bacteroidales bacterium]
MGKLLNHTLSILLSVAIGSFSAPEAEACTSMLVSARASATGRPLMWKHRDTDARDNFMERVEPEGSALGFTALYNGGDSLLREAWMGINDAGFAVMNTASYNLAPDTAKYCDREGEVMRLALERCRSLADFEQMLAERPRPMGVQANFGAMDAEGGMAYYETNDVGFVKYDVNDTAEGWIVRTNYSESGDSTGGFGYIRHQNVYDILDAQMQTGKFAPEDFTERASRSFWHSLLQKDYLHGPDRWVIDQDFIPRAISSASIVIEGGAQDPDGYRLWVILGYPPIGQTWQTDSKHLPDALRPTQAGWHSPECMSNLERKRQVFPITRGSGPKYIDMEALRRLMPTNP